MASGWPPGDPPDPRWRRRNARASDQGLRDLGSRIEGGRPGSASVANEQGLRALGDQVERAGQRPRPAPGFRRSGKPKWSTRRKVFTIVGAVLVFFLALAGGLYGYLQYRYNQIQKVHVASEVQPVSGQPFNMLVLGSDSRVGETNTNAFGSSAQVTGQRSDVVMIWHVDPGTHQIAIVSIPRDTMVSIPGHQDVLGQFNRINSNYNYGVDQLVQAIEDNFGIPINHVVQVDFGGFQGAVNALGGVWMNFPYPARDAYSGLNITTPGCQLLNGFQALGVARSRDYQYLQNGTWTYDPTGDLGRIKRQDSFLRALVDAAKSKLNPLTLNAFLGSIPQGIVIDDNLSLGQLVSLGLHFHSFNPDALNSQTLPTISNGDVSPWGDVLFVDQPAAQQLLVSVFGNQLRTPTTPPPNTALQTPAPPQVSAASAQSGSSQSGSGGSSSASSQPPPYDPTPCSPH